MIEVKAGVFVGSVNALIRETLWERAISNAEHGSVHMIWKTNNEQGFDLKAHQSKNYIPIDMDGIWLILKTNTSETK